MRRDNRLLLKVYPTAADNAANNNDDNGNNDNDDNTDNDKCKKRHL